MDVVETPGEPAPLSKTFETKRGFGEPIALPYVMVPLMTAGGVGVFVGVFVIVLVGVLVAVFVGVGVGVNVSVAVAVAVLVGVSVGVLVGVFVGVDAAAQLLVRIETSPPLRLPAAKSCLPSPLKSPTATEKGWLPATKFAGGLKLPVPLPNKTERLNAEKLAVERS